MSKSPVLTGLFRGRNDCGKSYGPFYYVEILGRISARNN